VQNGTFQNNYRVNKVLQFAKRGVGPPDCVLSAKLLNSITGPHPRNNTGPVKRVVMRGDSYRF